MDKVKLVCWFGIRFAKIVIMLEGIMKWLPLVALAISLVLGFLIVSNKNHCDRLLRFIRGDTTLEYERPNDPTNGEQ